MSNGLTRRTVLGIGLGALAAPSIRSAAAQAGLPPSPMERPLGKPDAPVTVIEYFSLSCGNCARFHNQILPRIKQEYIDTGKVRFVFRDYPLDQGAFDAAILAHCAGPERYHSFLQVLFKEKETWAHAKDYLRILYQFGQLGGVSAAQYTACRESKSFTDPILQMALDGRQTLKVNATPTFVINGTNYAGVLEFDKFAQIIDPLLPK